MANSTQIVREVVRGLLTGIAPEHQADGETIIASLAGNRKWRALHEKLHAGLLTPDAFAAQVTNRLKPLICRHRNLAGGKLKKVHTRPNRPMKTIQAKINKDGRVNVPSEILDLIAGTLGGIPVGRGSSALNSQRIGLGKDGRLRLTKTLRKAMGFSGTETSITISAFAWGVSLS